MPDETRPCDRRRLRLSLEDRLDDREQAELADHLETCGACRDELERLAAASRYWGEARSLRDSVLDAPAHATVRLDFPHEDDDDRDGGDGPSRAWLRLLDPPDPSRPAMLGRVGDYEVVEVLGQGGMGVVLKAREPSLDRMVAIKLLNPSLAHSASARRRFQREAKAAAAVGHEHIVAIHAVDEFRGLPYLVMQFIPGRSLQERIDATGPLATREVLRIGMQAARALAAAHAQGVVHRDIKPANILLENCVEKVKLTDFGLARAVDDASVTQSGVIAGTPQYMAPEQARGEPVDGRTDLFALGAVLYAMISGRPPFRAPSTMAMLKRVCEDRHRPVREIDPETPDWLASIVDRLLAKEPADRFQTAGEVADLLEQGLAHLQQPSASERPSLPRGGEAVPPEHLLELDLPAPKMTRQRPRLRLALAACLSAAVLASLGVVRAGGLAEVADYVATVLRIKTPEGTLVVKVDDPEVKVEVDNETLVINGAGPQQIRLRTGPHRVVATRNGQPVRDEVIAISRGTKQVVAIDFEAEPPVSTGTAILRTMRRERGTAAVGTGSVSLSAGTATESRAATAPFPPVPPVPPTSHSATFSGRLTAPAAPAVPSPPSSGVSVSVSAPEVPAAPSVPAAPEAPSASASGVSVSAPEVPAAPSVPAVPAAPEVPSASASGVSVQAVPSPPAVPVPPSAAAGSGMAMSRSVTVRRGSPALPATGRALVWSLAFTPDGRNLVIGQQGLDGAPSPLRIWNVGGKELKDLDVSARPYRSVAVSPDGATVASGTSGGQVQQRNLHGEEERIDGYSLGAPVTELRYSRDGQNLFVGTRDRGVALIKARLRNSVVDTVGGQRVNGIALSPDGTHLAVAGERGQVNILGLVGSGGRRELMGGGLDVESVDYSPDGTLIASASRNYMHVYLWDARTGKVRSLIDDVSLPILCVRFSPDGKLLAASEGEADTGPRVDRYRVRIWDVATRKLVHALAAHDSGIPTLAFSPDGKTLASGSLDQSVKLWDVASGDLRKEIVPGEGAASVTASSSAPATPAPPSPPGRAARVRESRAAARAGSEKARGPATPTAPAHPSAPTVPSVPAPPAPPATPPVSERTTASESITTVGGRRSSGSGPRPGPVRSLDFTPDGHRLIIGQVEIEKPGASVQVWDLESRSVTGAMSEQGSCSVMAVSPEGISVALGAVDGGFHLWKSNASETSYSGRFSLAGRILAVDFMPEGRELVVGTKEDGIGIVKIDGEQASWHALDRRLHASAVAVRPDGKQIAAAGAEGAIRFYNLHGGQVARGGVDGVVVTSMAFSPDGKVLASVGPDRRVRLWDATSGQAIHTSDSFEKPVVCVRFSPDGKLIAASEGEGGESATTTRSVIRLMKATTLGDLRTLKAHRGGIPALAFSPDGKTLASGGLDHAVKLWEVASGEVRETLVPEEDEETATVTRPERAGR